MQTIEERLDQLEKRRGLLTVGSIAMMVAIAIQLSACGKDLAGPSLTTCDASEIRATPLEGRDLTSCPRLSLRGADLTGAILRGAILSEADLSFAILRGANLRNANLWNANLRGAILPEADLRGANLRNANLRNANLEGANLEGAYNMPTLSAHQESTACWSDCG